jgi:hypothetical protein
MHDFYKKRVFPPSAPCGQREIWRKYNTTVFNLEALRHRQEWHVAFSAHVMTPNEAVEKVFLSIFERRKSLILLA